MGRATGGGRGGRGGVYSAVMLEQGYAGGGLLLPLVLAPSLTTVAVHGLTLGWVARRLDLSER